MSEQRFATPELGKWAQLFPLFIAVVPTLTVVMALALATHGAHRTPARLYLLALLFPAIAAVFAWAWRDRELRLRDGVLHFGRLPWRRVRIADLDLAAARVVDLRRESALQPVWKIAGTRLPGFHSGWFRLRDGRRAFARLTDWKRVLVLPRPNGRVYLFSVTRAEALLDALRTTHG